MKNKEKYFDFIVKAFADIYVSNCDFRKKHILEQKGCEGITCLECNKKTVDWLEQEYQEPPILDGEERKYLSAIIRPWRDKVRDIFKTAYNEYEYIVIEYYDNGYLQAIRLPLFENGTMYKGMELIREYSLEDLGL